MESQTYPTAFGPQKPQPLTASSHGSSVIGQKVYYGRKGQVQAHQ